MRVRWPHKHHAYDLQEFADGTIKRIKKPLHPWWPWSWILHTERVLLSPILCAFALLIVQMLDLSIKLIIALLTLIAIRVWWICQQHKTKLLLWKTRTSYWSYALIIAIAFWLIKDGSQQWLLPGTSVIILARLWHFTKGWDNDRLLLKKKWGIALGMPGKRLAGSSVRRVKYEDGIYKLFIDLPRGKFTTADVEKAINNVAGAMRTHPQCIHVERTDDDARPIVHVLSPKTLDKVTKWPGDAISNDGIATVGTMANDKPARLQLWSEIGSKIIWFVGARGSGKSRAVHLLLAAAMRSGLVALDIIDAKGGVDLGVWRKHAHFFGITVEDAKDAVNRANAIHDARLSQLASTGSEKFRIGIDGPLWLLVIEEAPEVLRDKDVAEGVARLARISRASGVGVLFVSQIAKVDIIGGRGVAANIDTRVIFECDRQTAGAAIDGKVFIDMAQMPTALPGTALFIGEGTDSGMFGRWFDIDPKVAVSHVVQAHIDQAVADVINVGLIPATNNETTQEVNDETIETSSEIVTASSKEDVVKYLNEHPDTTSAEISRVTGVPSRTIRRWRTHK
jgi:hypothetical protein